MRAAGRAPADYWVSYADLMLNLLLVFILVLVTAMEHHRRLALRTRRTITEQQTALVGNNRTIQQQREAIGRQLRQLADRGAQLDALRRGLDERDRELVDRTEKLTRADATLVEKDRALATRETELVAARDSLARRDGELAQQTGELQTARQQLSARESEVGRTRALLAEQRQRIETLFGVRRSIVEALRKRFAAPDLKSPLGVDPNTGAIRFGEGILFEEDQATLHPTAEPVLRDFLDRYLGSLLGTELFRKHVAQILIEGHTNDNGTYLHNLELSQRRAQTVMGFLLSQKSPHEADLKRLVTASGRSFSDPIRSAGGAVDKVRSRRIEFKFRLKDEETLREIRDVLGAAPAPAASTTATTNSR